MQARHHEVTPQDLAKKLLSRDDGLLMRFEKTLKPKAVVTVEVGI